MPAEFVRGRMLETVKTLLFRGDGAAVVYECRRCGTSVTGDTAECPACGAEDIVSHPTG